MSIQSTTLPKSKTDYAALKESFSSTIERDFLEKIDSMQGLDQPIQPKFMEILDSSINEVRPQTLPKKDVPAKTSKSGKALDFKPSKSNNSLSDHPVVKDKERSVSSRCKLTDDTPKNSSGDAISQDDHPVKEKKDFSYIDPEVAISLTTPFLKDTLSEINVQQNKVITDFTGDDDLLLDLPLEGELGAKIPNEVIQIEVLAGPLKEGKVAFDKDQMQLMTDLLTDQQVLTEQEIVSETMDPAADPIHLTPQKTLHETADAKSIADMPLLDAIKESQKKVDPEQKLDRRVGELNQLLQNEISPHAMEKVIPVLGTQANFSNLEGGNSFKASSSNGVVNGMSVFSSPTVMRTTLTTEAAMAQSRLQQLNALMQVKDHFKAMLSNKETHLKVLLTPEELGTVEITLDILKDTVVSTLIKAERRDTMELLARHAEEIDMIFKNAGLQSDLMNMNFSSSQQEHSSEEVHFSNKHKGTSSMEEVILPPLESIHDDSDTLINIKA